MFQRFCSRHIYLIRVSVVLAVITSLFAEASITHTAANSRVGTALPFFAACPASCVQNFDSVAPPALPTGWTAAIPIGLTGDLPWRTVSTTSDSAPNSAFANDPNHVTDNVLISRTFPIVSSAVMTFSRRNNLEVTYDGMVLEISIDGAAFTDVLNAGSFASGGYNFPISTAHGSPISGRQAWTGDTTGFVITQVNLSSSVIGHTVTFRWRVATDDSIASVGAFIDNITLTGWSELPANDNFVNAQTISGVSGMVNGHNVGATKEINEPNHAGNTGGASVWYRWQAPDTGRFVFTTYHSNFETLLGVYTGNTLPGTLVASNDLDPNQDGSIFSPCGPRTSRVSFNATGGVVYRIAVDRRSISASGNIVLRWGRSASISGRITDVSGRPVPVDPVRLLGDACRDTQSAGTIAFTDVPTGGNYNFAVSSGVSSVFNRYGTSVSIAPLAGDVSNFNYYQITPAYQISGTVTMPGGDVSGVTVMCVATGPGIFSTPAFFTGSNYACSALPTFGDYVITPAKVGFRFTPASRTELHLTQNVSGDSFTGTPVPTYTISGRVTNSTGITGVSGIAIGLSGSQTASRLTDSNGNYSFTGVTEGGNYTITPSAADYTFAPLSQSFNNLTANQTANFTATVLLQLILDQNGQVAAEDSLLGLRDPFPVVNSSNVLNGGVDRNTRVTIFVSNLQLGPGGVPSSVVINLIGSNNQSYDIPAEDVRPVSNLGFTQVIFRLPDNLTAGTCTLVVKAAGQTSNIGAMRIR